ncbi:purine-nucleoside phosphorylase [Pedobacter sp. UYP30]|uniref:purine-nucleoside phosphorylase n=1 Tax=Pedobacter sp. UYP30 TaxID=1756400 RepID=UPI003394F9A5
MLRAIQETVEYIRIKTENFKPEVGIILGTGLGDLVNSIEIKYQLMYSNIPNFPISTLEFHSGKLIFGTLNGKNIVAMQGRLHYYEGYSMQQITFPIRVMKGLGIENLFVSNAAGSLNPNFKKGDLMIISDHINLQPDNPLRGLNESELGPRFPDMSEPYKRSIIKKAITVAKNVDVVCHKGVYVAVTGPNLETKAEYKYLRLIGADAVGMSTVPEVIVANHAGIPVFALSVLTDEGFAEDLQPFSLTDILATAAKAEPKMTEILTRLIATL